VPKLPCEAFPTDPVILHHSSVTILNLILYTLYYINVCLFIENLPTAQLIQHCSGNGRKIINEKLEKYRGNQLHKFPAQTDEYHGLRFKLRDTKISSA
jgi:hypothetical protein